MTSETGLTTIEAAKPIQTGAALHALLDRRSDRLANALEGTGISPERFIEGAAQAIAGDEKLKKCTAESVLLACLESAQIGLEPTGILNQAWLVAYKNVARLMIGYGGYITLLDRSRSYDFIEAVVVYEHDEFWFERGTNPQIHHIPAPDGERGKFGHKNGGGYWVAWKKGSTRPQWDVMSWAEMERRRKISQRAEQDMWKSWPEEMYRKTILRWGMKQMPLTPIVQRAYAYETDNLNLTSDRVTVEPVDRRGALLDRIAHGSPDAATEGGSDPGPVSEGGGAAEPPEEPAPSPLPEGCTCEPGPNINDRLVDPECPVHKGK